MNKNNPFDIDFKINSYIKDISPNIIIETNEQSKPKKIKSQRKPRTNKPNYDNLENVEISKNDWPKIPNNTLIRYTTIKNEEKGPNILDSIEEPSEQNNGEYLLVFKSFYNIYKKQFTWKVSFSNIKAIYKLLDKQSTENITGSSDNKIIDYSKIEPKNQLSAYGHELMLETTIPEHIRDRFTVLEKRIENLEVANKKLLHCVSILAKKN